MALRIIEAHVPPDLCGDAQEALREFSHESWTQLRCDRVRFLLRRFGDWSMTRYHPEQRAPQADS